MPHKVFTAGNHCVWNLSKLIMAIKSQVFYLELIRVE